MSDSDRELVFSKETFTDEEWNNFDKILSKKDCLPELKKHKPADLAKLEPKTKQNLLHLSTKHNNLEATMYLLTIDKLNIDQVDQECGRSAFGKVLQRPGSEEMVRLFLRSMRSSPNMSWEIIAGSCGELSFGDEKIIKTFCSTAIGLLDGVQTIFVDFLMNSGWGMDAIAKLNNGELIILSKILKAIELGEAKEVKELIENNSNIFEEEDLNILLLKSSETNKPNGPIIITMLLNKGAQINGSIDCRSPIDIAITFNNVSNALMLLHMGADIEEVEFDEHKSEILSNTIFDTYNFNILDLLMDLQEYPLLNTISGGVFLSLPRGLLQYAYELMSPNHPKLNIRKRAITYLARLNHLGQDVEKYFEVMYDEYIDYYEQCKKELDVMKEHKVNENLTVWDILVKPTNDIIPLIRNTDFLQKVEKISKTNFSIYHKSLNSKLEEACKRKDWINKSVSVLSKCLPSSIKSNYLLLEKIVYFLGVPNLLNFD